MKKNRSRFTRAAVGFLLILCMLFSMGAAAIPEQQTAPPAAAALSDSGADNSLTKETDPADIPGETGGDQKQDHSPAPKTQEPAAVFVSAFASLADNVAKQSYLEGELEGVGGLNLPDALSASNADHVFDITGVTWAAEPAFDPNMAREYRFTAVLPEGYALEQSATLPVISVTIEAAPPQIQARAMLQSANEIQPLADEPQPGNGDYNIDDIAMMNHIIDEHQEMGLEPWTSGATPPVGWNEEATSTKDTVVSWNTDTPKRIEGLWLAGRNLIGVLDVTGLPALKTLDCSSNNLTGLYASSNMELETLYCSFNQLTEIRLPDEGGAPALKELFCQDNKLKELDVSKLVNLQKLICWSNALSSIDLSKNTKLKDFEGTDQQVPVTLTGDGNYTNGFTSTTPIVLLPPSTFGSPAIRDASKGKLKSTDKSVTSTSFTAGTNNYKFQISGTLLFTYENAAPYIENVPLQDSYLRDNSRDVHIKLSSDEGGQVYYYSTERFIQPKTPSDSQFRWEKGDTIDAGTQDLTFKKGVSDEDTYFYVYVRGDHGASNILRIEIPMWPTLHRFSFNGYSSNVYVVGLNKELEYTMDNTYRDIYFPTNSDQGSVLVDGVPLVVNQDFTWHENNYIMSIDLKPGFLDTLQPGEHTLELLSINSRRIAETFYTRLESGYIVTVETDRGGTVSGGGHFENGESCTVTATPDPRYHFVRWETTNTYSTTMSTEAVYTFPVTSSIALRAVFEINQYTVSASVSPAGAGSTRISGIGQLSRSSANFNEGDSVTVNIDSTTRGYDFSHWSENGRRLTGSQEYSFTATGDRALVANFAPREYEIHYYGLDEGMENPNPDSFSFRTGTITLRPPVPEKNAKGETFAGWSTSKTDNDRTTSLDTNRTSDINLYAHWVKEDAVYNITYKGLLGGSTENLPKTYTAGVGKNYFPDATAGADGLTFVEWRKGGPDGPVIDSIPKFSEGDIELYAIFRIPITFVPSTQKKYKNARPNSTNPDDFVQGGYFTIYPSSQIEGYTTYSNLWWNVTIEVYDENAEKPMKSIGLNKLEVPILTSDYLYYLANLMEQASAYDITAIKVQPIQWDATSVEIPVYDAHPLNQHLIFEFMESMKDPDSPLDENYGKQADVIIRQDDVTPQELAGHASCCGKSVSFLDTIESKAKSTLKSAVKEMVKEAKEKVEGDVRVFYLRGTKYENLILMFAHIERMGSIYKDNPEFLDKNGELTRESFGKGYLKYLNSTDDSKLSEEDGFFKYFIQMYGLDQFWIFVDHYATLLETGGDAAFLVEVSDAAGTRVMEDEKANDEKAYTFDEMMELLGMPVYDPETAAVGYLSLSRERLEAMHPGRNVITLENPGNVQVFIIDREEMLALLDNPGPVDEEWAAEYEAMKAVGAPVVAQLEDGSFVDAATLPKDVDLTPYFILIIAVAAALIVVGTLLIRRKRRMALGTDEKPAAGGPAEKN